ncbi:hypothetical protein ACFORJ_01600 [Corynebacterium hansenii]|uniref:Transposase n=1 Tax=Corynebacterium hansenii TaxID=394964 RepID=A0ABV7ZM54_9CORY|nr:hypothetical protein [Corynebacterium hansenii]WJY99306.1 hypothetical protein CHAN_03390 [Corynebacterium hansenii]
MHRDLTALAVAVGVMNPPARPRWRTHLTWALITITTLTITLWIGHQADQHLTAILEATA